MPQVCRNWCDRFEGKEKRPTYAKGDKFCRLCETVFYNSQDKHCNCCGMQLRGNTHTYTNGRKRKSSRKIKNRIYNAKWSAANREFKKESNRRSYLKHREKKLQYYRQYNATHKKENSLRFKKWYEQNREKVLAKQKAKRCQ